jgi:hypothetical protein
MIDYQIAYQRLRTTFALAILGLLVMGGFAKESAAQILSWGVDTFQAPPDPRWGPITVRDVEAAYRLLRDNHPGAAPELHDLAFQEKLHTAHALALKRARTVTSYPGYLAVLTAVAASMGDKHIWDRPTFVVNTPRWAGIILSKRGNSWTVSDVDQSQSALLNASLTGCDGEGVEDLARKNLGESRADWSIGAQQTQAAPWLLVDESNPFITRPKICTFGHNGQRQTVTLDWTRIKREDLLPRLKKAIGAGEAGFGVRQVGGGYWIALQSLSDARTLEVVKAVEEQKTALREASFVVLDLRGNHGGSSLIGRQIAASLLGSARVDARLGPVLQPDCSGPDGAWRASEGTFTTWNFCGLLPSCCREHRSNKSSSITLFATRVRLALKARSFPHPLSAQSRRRNQPRQHSHPR